MPTWAPHPVTVDGVALDTLAFAIESKVRAWPGSRAADVPIPGVDGMAASVNDDLDAATWTLSMHVLGADVNGAIPGGSNATSEYRKNLDALSHLFVGPRHRLLDVREQVHVDGTIRQAYAKVVDVVSPETSTGGTRGKFGVSLLIPEGMAQDVNYADWSQTNPTSGNAYEVTTLAGATAPINDAIILVTGPANTPKVTDVNTGAYVQLNQNLAATEKWRINCATWSTRYGNPAMVLGSSDATGTDGQSSTIYGGGNARFLRMLPVLSSGTRRVSLSLTGTAFTSATALSVRARRKWLQ